MTTRSIDAIVVGKRTRVRMGDMAKLIASIEARGLLHPPAVTPDGHLVAGFRRLEACRALGWTDIPVTVVTTVTDELSALLAEGEENDCREGFIPSEAVAHAARIKDCTARLNEEERRVAALEREAAKRTSCGNFPQLVESPAPSRPLPSRPTPTARKTRERVAEGTGYSGRTVEKATHVVTTAERHPDPAVRAVADEAAVQMDATGKVDGAYRKVVEAEKDALLRKADDLGDEEGRAELVRSRLRANAAKALYAYSTGLPGLDPERVAEVIPQENWRSWETAYEETLQWWKRLFAARPKGLRVVNGGRA